VVSDGSCTSCVRAGSAGRTTKKGCALSLHRALEVGGFFGAQLPCSWHTADQSGMQSSYDPRKAQKKEPEQAKNAQGSKTTQSVDTLPVRCQMSSQQMTPRDAYTISPYLPASHKGGFALAQRFPQPLVDGDSSDNAIQGTPSVTVPAAALGLRQFRWTQGTPERDIARAGVAKQKTK
jgi:hypothetical protein